MSLQFNATSDNAVRTSDVAATGQEWTMMVDFMPEGNPTGHILMVVQADPQPCAGFSTWYTGGVTRLYVYNGNSEVNTNSPLTNATWYTLALCQNSSGMMGYLWANGGSRTLIYDGVSNAYAEQDLTNSACKLMLGTNMSLHGTSTTSKGCYRNVKWWKGTKLTEGELDIEATSDTPQKPNCTIHYPCDELDFSGNVLSDSTNNEFDATITSGSYSTSEPSYLGGASSIPLMASYYNSLRTDS